MHDTRYSFWKAEIEVTTRPTCFTIGLSGEQNGKAGRIWAVL